MSLTPGTQPCRGSTDTMEAEARSAASDLQMEIYQRMSPTEKWRQAMALYATARKIKAAGVRLLHPDWSEDRVEAEVKHIFLHAAN